MLDVEGQLVPVGVVGELYIGGAGLSRGYHGRGGLTAERFVPHPYSESPGERLYRTGDMVRWLPTGELEFIGRLDHQVKVRGFRVELGEIEHVMLGHGGVKDVVVLAREDEPGDKRLVAYVVVEGVDKVEVNRDDLLGGLRGYVQERLPSYMVPSAIVLLDSMPLTVNGKVDRDALPEPDMSLHQVGYVAPEGVTEELLAGLWCSILKLERVGRFDNFFALGGHSLLVTQLVSRIEEAFGVELAIRELFEHDTVEAQAYSKTRRKW